MAWSEADREDLFAEATALTRRIELLLPGATEPIVAGCRRNGGWSIYFGPDPCYHFDLDGRLRRAFASGYRYRSQGNTLARLARVRTRDEVIMQRSDLSVGDLAEFMQRMREQVLRLQQSLAAGAIECRRTFPQDSDILIELDAAATRILAEWPGLAPAIPTRRH